MGGAARPGRARLHPEALSGSSAAWGRAPGLGLPRAVQGRGGRGEPSRAPGQRGARPAPSSTRDPRAPRVYTARLHRQHELKTKYASNNVPFVLNKRWGCHWSSAEHKKYPLKHEAAEAPRPRGCPGAAEAPRAPPRTAHGHLHTASGCWKLPRVAASLT